MRRTVNENTRDLHYGGLTDLAFCGVYDNTPDMSNCFYDYAAPQKAVLSGYEKSSDCGYAATFALRQDE